MKVKIQSIHFDADTKLLNFVDERISKLSSLYDGVLGGEVFLRLDKAADSENKIAEIKLHIPGNDLFARKQCKTFEEATDNAVDALKSQLVRRKEKVKGI
jgi:putative sigma-54 modulation protein